MEKALHPIPEVAKALSVSPDTVRTKIREGKIRAVRIATRVLVSSEEIDRISREGYEAALTCLEVES